MSEWIDPGVLARARATPQRRHELDVELLDAVARADWGALNGLLDEGASPDARFPAAKYGSDLTVAMLCAARMEADGRWGPSNRWESVDRVLRLCDPRSVDGRGMTPLMCAAAEANMRAVRILAPRSEVLAVSGALDMDFDSGWPALFFALNLNQHVGLPDTQHWRDCKEMLLLLGEAGAWKIKSGLGHDAKAIAAKSGNCPHRHALVLEISGAVAAREQASELDAAVVVPAPSGKARQRSI